MARDVVEAQRVLCLVGAMEDLGAREIQIIGPDDCACLGIDSNLREVVGVLKGRNHRSGRLAGHCVCAVTAVTTGDAVTVALPGCVPARPVARLRMSKG
jgi:hypothetical protein